MFYYQSKLIKKKIQIDCIPGDKSISHRAIILGSLAVNKSVFKRFLMSKDCLHTATIFQQLGVNITFEEKENTVFIEGVGLKGLQPYNGSLYVGNSGTGIRLISGILAGQSFDTKITGDHSIEKRPMKRIIDPLTKMGAIISGHKLVGKQDIYPPLSIQSSSLHAISYLLPVASAQVKSAVLFASLYAEGTTVITEPESCRNHSEVMLKAFGANIQINGNQISCNGESILKNPSQEPILIPADFSSASFFIVLGLISNIEQMVLKNIGLNPTRSRLLDILKEMGAIIEIVNQTNDIEPSGDIIIKPSELKNISVNPIDIPFMIDEVPILAVAAMFGSGKLIVTNAEELRVKESDRIHSVVQMVEAFGGTIEEFEDGFILTGGFNPKSPQIETFYDHRIAMSAIIAATAADISIELDSVDAISTSFPNFFEILNKI